MVSVFFNLSLSLCGRSVLFVEFVVAVVVCWDGMVGRLVCLVVLFLCLRSFWYTVGMSMCLLKVSLFVLYTNSQSTIMIFL